LPWATKVSPGGSAADVKFLYVPPGTGPTDPDDGAVAEFWLLLEGPTAATGAAEVLVGPAVTVIVVVTPLIAVVTADTAPTLAAATEAGGRATCTMTTTVNATRSGTA